MAKRYPEWAAGLDPADLSDDDTMVILDGGTPREVTVAALRDAIGGGAVDSVDGQTGAVDLSGSYVAKGTAPANVLDRANPLKNAIADGDPHPLSERFATLDAAQAVFPRATALTEQLDRHAVQEALDNHAAVRIPGGTYRVDATVYTADGTYRALGPQTVWGDGPGATVLQLVDDIDAVWVLASGNTRGMTTNFSGPSSADIPDECPSLRLAHLTVDGNRDNTTTGATAQRRHGVYLARCPDLEIEDVEVRECRQDGLVVQGISDANTDGGTIRRFHGHDNTNRGLSVRNQIRHFTYSVVRCHDNDGDGFILDHSWATAANIHVHDNGTDGLFVRNVEGVTITGVRAQGNGVNGVRFSEFNDSFAGGIVAIDNGTGGTGADILLDDDELPSGRGATHESRFSGLVCGNSDDVSGGNEEWALAIADGVTNIDIDGLTVVGAGSSGGLRRGSDETVRIEGWEPIVLGAKQLTRLSATATFTEGGAFPPYWLLDDAQSDSVCGQPPIPSGWSEVDVEVDWFVATSAVSGNVKLDFYNFSFDEGDTISVSVTTPDQTGTHSAAAQNVVSRTTIATGVEVTPGADAYHVVRREGSHASDTLDGGNIGVLRMRLIRTA